MTDDIRKLLGGYATGTLTEEERQALFAAALNDQALFEALADEQALKELLEDSAARGELLRATETRHFTVGSVLAEWFHRPKAKVLVGIGAVLLAAIMVRETMVWHDGTPRTQTVAVMRAPTEPSARPMQAPPAPQEAKPQPRARQSSAKRERSGAQPQPSEPVAGEVRLEAPKQAAVSPPRPAADEASPDAFTRVATADGLELKYTVLLRNASGEYVAVAPEHAFAPADRARIRVESNRSGMLSVTGAGDSQAVTIRNVRPDSPVVLPADVTFDDAKRSQTIHISFLAEAGVPLRGFSAEREAPQPPAIGPRANSLALPQSPAAGATKTSSAPGILNIEITLEQKQP